MNRQALIQKAIDIRKNAYAPFSNYSVGAVLVTQDGKIFTGVNIENCAYSPSDCAEKVAFYKAISEGERVFSLLIVATDSPEPSFPCGSCRQVIAEFCEDLEIVVTNCEGKSKTVFLKELFPFAFVFSPSAPLAG